MKVSKNLFILLIIMAIPITLSATQTGKELHEDLEEDNTDDLLFSGSEEPSFLRGNGRFLAQNGRVVMTCDKYPRVCRATGSPGPDCCNKQCVNVMTDRLNCGMCGKKCRYSEMCCKGKCVNLSVDKKNCGRCNNKCKNGSSCVYGMCNYA